MLHKCLPTCTVLGILLSMWTSCWHAQTFRFPDLVCAACRHDQTVHEEPIQGAPQAVQEHEQGRHCPRPLQSPHLLHKPPLLSQGCMQALLELLHLGPQVGTAPALCGQPCRGVSLGPPQVLQLPLGIQQPLGAWAPQAAVLLHHGPLCSLLRPCQLGCQPVPCSAQMSLD